MVRLPSIGICRKSRWTETPEFGMAHSLFDVHAMSASSLYHPGDAVDWPEVKRALNRLAVDDLDAARAAAGMDYHWYSPVLTERLRGLKPDLVVTPRSLDEVQQLAAVCVRHRVPLTVRGGGTGNYGQCVPLHGGIVMDATALNRVLHIEPGGNGIIVEVEIALTEAIEWQHTITLFDSYDAVLRFGLEVGQRSIARDIDVFQLSAVERRITPYYAGLRDRLQGHDAVFAQVSPDTLPAFEALAQAMGGRVVVRGSEDELIAEGLPSATECAYNHTTLEALKSDRGVTYLQVAYPGPLASCAPGTSACWACR
jgi:FAD/FMN-containing dehydrogenase